MYLLVGLGNPGSQYQRTRHNIGFMALDLLGAHLRLDFTSSKWQAITAKGVWDDKKIMLVKPQTFMNLSGDPVSAITNYFNIDMAKIIVIHDDLDLPCGQLKLAINRGPGGHNGLRSLNARLGSIAYSRLRFGIGRPTPHMPVDRYVLSKFSAAEEDVVSSALDTSLHALHLFITVGITQAMQEINRK